MNQCKHLQPSDSYRFFAEKIPQELSDKNLIVIHYLSEFKCTRWTTRKRDLLKHDGKKLNFDTCVGYLVDSDTLARIFDSDAALILGYRLYDETWVHRVDKIDYSIISYIEYYG